MATLEPTPVVTVDAALAHGAERYAEGAASRQAEVDALVRQRNDLSGQLGDATAAAHEAQGQLRTLRSEYDAHMATDHPVAPPPEPESSAPVVARTSFGACPGPTGGASGVLSKYGSKASVRIFNPGGLARVTRPSTATRVHVSWKPTLGSTITDAQVIEACTGLRDGDIVEVWHEADVKYRKGQDLDAMVALSSQLHQRVTSLRAAGRIAKVLTCHTWAGWSVDSTSSVNPANLHAPADLLGIDMDGIPADDDFYPYAARQMGSKLIGAYRAGGYAGWTIPEFCMPSVASDPDRSRRIAWLQSEVAKIRQGVPSQQLPPPLMIAWFDTAGIIGDTERLTTSNEIAAWSSLVATND